MNNFRRTVREVVYVVKVNDLTIHKRLDEFKVTESSDLTVEEFRTIDLETAHDPPAFYQARDPKSKRKRRRARQLQDDESESNQNDSTNAADRPNSSEPPASQAPARVDAEGFAIPAIPIDPALLAASNRAISEIEPQPPHTPQTTPSQPSSDEPPAKRPRGRPKKQQATAPTAAELRQESDIEKDISQWLNDPSTQEHVAAHSKSLEHAKTVAFIERLDRHVSDSVDISDSEFADDPEVANCLLTPEEVEMKERVWVHENRDYLREQQAKLLKKQLEEENGTARVIVRRKRKKGKMGDLKRYGDPDAETGGISGASTPAEATIMMLKERGFSKKINYAMINHLFGSGPPSGGSSSVAGSEGAEATTEPTLPNSGDRSLELVKAPAKPLDAAEVVGFAPVPDLAALARSFGDEDAAEDEDDEDDAEDEDEEYEGGLGEEVQGDEFDSLVDEVDVGIDEA